MKRLLVCMLTGIMILSTTAFASDTDLEARVAALEERVAALEAIIADDQGNASDESVSVCGIYVVGEDISAGTYTVTVVDNKGWLAVYKSYDEYLKVDGDLNDGFMLYHLASESAKQSMIDAEQELAASMYTSEIASLRLDDGMCLVVDTAKTEFTKLK